jgi:hypothetical protein
MASSITNNDIQYRYMTKRWIKSCTPRELAKLLLLVWDRIVSLDPGDRIDFSQGFGGHYIIEYMAGHQRLLISEPDLYNEEDGNEND